MANIEMISNCELIKIKHLKPGDIFAADKPRFDGCTCQLYVYTDHKTPATTLCITDANLRGFSYEDEVYRYDEYFVTGLRLEPNGADTFGGLGIGDVKYDKHGFSEHGFIIEVSELLYDVFYDDGVTIHVYTVGNRT